MDAIPMITLFVPYFFVLLVSGLFLFFNLFHLWRYGVEGVGTTLLLLGYMFFFALIAGGGWIFLGTFPLEGTFSLTEFLPSSSGASSFEL